MVQIVTDSVVDLPPQLCSERQIQVIPLLVYSNGATFRDGIDITVEALFERVARSGELPKTAAPAIPSFLQRFDQPEPTVYIGLSSRLSATWHNAVQAKEMLPQREIHLIDSLNLSTGIAQLVLHAADLRDAGLSATAIAERVRGRVPTVRTAFVVDTLDYLHKGGRCSALQSIMGSLLHIRPVIAVRPDGTLGVKAKVRGSRAKAIHSMVEEFAQALPHVDLQRVLIPHTSSAAEVETLRDEILRIAPIEEVWITQAGSVIASHCGPGTIGLVYCTKV